MPFQISHHCRFISTSLASVGCPGACCGLVVPVADRWNWINQLARFNSPTPAQLQPICDLHEITNQCVTVPKILNDTDTDTFSGTIYFQYRYRYFFWYQIFLIPVPKLSTDTKFDRYRFRDFFPVPNFFRYRFRYHHKNEKFSVPVLIRYRYPL